MTARKTLTTYRQADGGLIYGEFSIVFDLEFFDGAIPPIKIIEEVWVRQSVRRLTLPKRYS